MSQSMAAFTPIKFSLKLVELLYNDTLYPSITNTKYEGQIKDAGDKVRVRTSHRITLSTYTKGMTLVKQDLNPTSEDLEIDQLKYFSFGVDDVDKIQNDINGIAEYAANAKRDMAETLDTDLLDYMRKNVGQADADDTASVVGTSYATGTVEVAVTTGVVTGTGTTFTSAMVGGYFKATGHSVSYLVTAFTNGTTITITDLDGSGYSGGAIAAGASYTIAGATAVTLTAATIYGKIVDLSTALNKALCPREDRFLVVNAAFEGMLRKAPEFIPAVSKAYENVL